MVLHYFEPFVLFHVPLFQATMMMYQALGEYWTSVPEQDLYLDVFLPDRSKPEKYYINHKNIYVTRTFEVRSDH